jgi:hypothetical protein
LFLQGFGEIAWKIACGFQKLLNLPCFLHIADPRWQKLFTAPLFRQTVGNFSIRPAAFSANDHTLSNLCPS